MGCAELHGIAEPRLCIFCRAFFFFFDFLIYQRCNFMQKLVDFMHFSLSKTQSKIVQNGFKTVQNGFKTVQNGFKTVQNARFLPPFF